MIQAANRFLNPIDDKHYEKQSDFHGIAAANNMELWQFRY